MDPKIVIGGVILAGLGALVLGLTRSGSASPATGVVVEQALQDERTYRQTLNGPGAAVRQGDAIKIVAAWVVSVQLDGSGETVRASIPDIRGKPPFAVGDRVSLTVLRRGLPPLWIRTFAQDVERVP
jgi:hypothetical protein